MHPLLLGQFILDVDDFLYARAVEELVVSSVVSSVVACIVGSR
jgi:hypothetical protein